MAKSIEACIKSARRKYRLVPQPHRDGGTCWMVLDRTNSGSGCVGTEDAGRSNYEKIIMFRALEAFDSRHDWHEYDWHTLTGPAEERCARMLVWRSESEQAAAEVAGIHALVSLMVGSHRRRSA